MLPPSIDIICSLPFSYRASLASTINLRTCHDHASYIVNSVKFCRSYFHALVIVLPCYGALEIVGVIITIIITARI